MADAAFRIGVVGVAGGWSSERLADAVARQTGARALLELKHVVADLDQRELRCGTADLTAFDALIIKKLGRRYAPHLLDRLEILGAVEAQGVRIFSHPRAIMRLLNRLACTLALRTADVPMPPTVITEHVDEAAAAVARFGRAILKPLWSTKARGMAVLTAGPDLAGQIAEFRAAGNHLIYVQKMVPLPGKDLGITFLGGEYLASYARVGHHESWNTTTDNGGRYEPVEPAPELIELARRAQAPFQLDFTCVDVAETPTGPVVFEVSAFGGFRGLLEAHQLDAAELYTAYVLGKLRS